MGLYMQLKNQGLLRVSVLCHLNDTILLHTQFECILCSQILSYHCRVVGPAVNLHVFSISLSLLLLYYLCILFQLFALADHPALQAYVSYRWGQIASPLFW